MGPQDYLMFGMCFFLVVVVVRWAVGLATPTTSSTTNNNQKPKKKTILGPGLFDVWMCFFWIDTIYNTLYIIYYITLKKTHTPKR